MWQPRRGRRVSLRHLQGSFPASTGAVPQLIIHPRSDGSLGPFHPIRICAWRAHTSAHLHFPLRFSGGPELRQTNAMTRPENRAVAPVWSGLSTSPSPTPTPSASAGAGAMADSTGLDGKSRTLQGPSAKEWARHREAIIGLYRQYPLKRVSEIMRRDFGFSARYARARRASPSVAGAESRPTSFFLHESLQSLNMGRPGLGDHSTHRRWLAVGWTVTHLPSLKPASAQSLPRCTLLSPHLPAFNPRRASWILGHCPLATLS